MIRQTTVSDCQVLADLAVLLWNSHTTADLTAEFSEAMNSGQTAFFMKYVDSAPVGFAQCSLRRDYVEGTETSPVGYLEGIFVQEEYRNNGYAAELLSACEAWAKSNDSTEFASDCELENTTSLRFHLAMGFEDVNRIICFTKKI